MSRFLLLLLFIPQLYASDIKIGYLTGKHLLTKGLNDNHPFIEVAENILIYKNSFDKTSVAAYGKIKSDVFALRIGATTGYQHKMEYKNNVYVSMFTVNGVTPFIVPSLEYDVGRVTFIGALMADSLNVGLSFNF